MAEQHGQQGSKETRKKEGTGEMTVREAGHRGGEKVRDRIEKGAEIAEKKGQHAA